MVDPRQAKLSNLRDRRQTTLSLALITEKGGALQPLSKRYLRMLYSYLPEAYELMESPSTKYSGTMGHILFHHGAPYREFHRGHFIFLSQYFREFERDILTGRDYKLTFELLPGVKVGEFYTLLMGYYHKWWTDEWNNTHPTDIREMFWHRRAWVSNTTHARRKIFEQFIGLIEENPEAPLAWSFEFLEKE